MDQPFSYHQLVDAVAPGGAALAYIFLVLTVLIILCVNTAMLISVWQLIRPQRVPVMPLKRPR
jgi:hypothetical protein